ncbi:MAG: hypothetical protein RTU92_07755 [Candidatus Thorarchaeota archaeon]
MPYYRYYKFAYTFGKLLVFILYDRYRAEGDSFKSKIIEIIEAGGSKSTTDILGETGFDISSKKLWEDGVRLARHLLKELETVADE